MEKETGIRKNISYSVGASMLLLAISFVVTLLVPRALGEDLAQFGYLQIFLFYVGYVGMLHLGWCDGILLQQAGKDYDHLDEKECSGQFRLFCTAQGVISAVVFATAFVCTKDTGYRTVWLFVAINIFFVNARNMLTYFLQATGRAKEFSIASILQFVAYTCFIVAFFLRKPFDYRIIVLGYTVGQFVALLCNAYYCRNLVFSKPTAFKKSVVNAKGNIAVGYKLLFSNVAALLMTGIVRFGIERSYSVELYARIALAFSVSNMVLTFVSAIEVVLFPELKKAERGKLENVYESLNRKLILLLFGGFCLYYPVQYVLGIWLPAYTQSFYYMSVLLPMCFFAAKMNLIVQNYMKVYRLEKDILWVNITGIGVAVLGTLISLRFLQSLTLALFCVLITQIIRCVLAEVFLAKRTGIRSIRYMVGPPVLTALFVLCHFGIGKELGALLYFVIYVSYAAIDLLGRKMMMGQKQNEI